MKNISKLVFCQLIFIFLFSQVFADTIKLKNGRSVEGIIKAEDGERIELEVGSGSVKFLKSEIADISRSSGSELSSLRERWKKNKLELDTVVYTGDPVHTIKTIAFLNGSGGSSVEKIIDLFNPDCILTGDIGYHHAKFAIDAGVALIDAGHFATEIIFKKLLAMHIEDIFIDRESTGIIISQLETNPFKIYQGANE